MCLLFCVVAITMNTLMVLAIVLTPRCVGSLTLEHHPVVHVDVPGATKFAIWRNRAFFIVPSLATTLWEVSWQPSLSYISRVRMFPSLKVNKRLCRGMEVASDIKIDTFGRLWVLDIGNDICPAKLIIYDLLFWRSSEISKHVFDSNEVGLNNFVVDPGTSRPLSKAYLAGPRGLFVYNLYQDRSWVIRANFNGAITSLAINRAGVYQRSLLYIEIDRRIVYQVSTSALQGTKANAEEIGFLLGENSAGLLSDSRGGLHYVMKRDFVALKWDTSMALEAESHGVSLQSAEVLSNVTCLALDAQKQVWALVHNGTDESQVWCVRLSI